MDSIFRYVDAHRKDWVNTVIKLVSQKSISCINEGVGECAQLVFKVLTDVGIDARIIEGYGPPLVYGEIKSSKKSAPCVLVYGHYDVQPPGDITLWSSDPFKPVEKDGRIFGRGVADDKGQFFTYIAAVQAFKDTTGDIPVNVKFIFEGEEEIYSPHLEKALNGIKELLACDVIVNADVAYHESGRPVIVLGNKGMYMAELEVRMANRDMHSMYSASVPSAAWRLIQVLSSMKDGNGKVLIKGFYDDVKNPTPLELNGLATIPDASEEFRKANGIHEFLSGTRSSDYRFNTAFEPTFNINSLKAGHLGPGTNSIIAGNAYARLDVRLVPDQTPEKMHELVLKHLKENNFDDVSVKWFGGMPLRVPLDHPFVLRVADVLRKTWRKEPVIYPGIGAFSPFRVFEDILNAPFIQVPIGNCDQNEHSINENLIIDDMMRGIKTAAAIMNGFADVKK